jgi:hypothetical protein
METEPIIVVTIDYNFYDAHTTSLRSEAPMSVLHRNTEFTPFLSIAESGHRNIKFAKYMYYKPKKVIFDTKTR